MCILSRDLHTLLEFYGLLTEAHHLHLTVVEPRGTHLWRARLTLAPPWAQAREAAAAAAQAEKHAAR